VASWFGSRAGWRGQSFPAMYDKLPDRNAIVFATNAKRPAFLRDHPDVKAPTVEMMSHPDNPYVKLLVVFGRDDNGTGLGEKGFGTGAGEGFGDIEWGGGGNRRLLNKVIPKLPQGLKYAGTIRLALYVAPDGSVSRVLPIEKSDPRLESACIEALRKWKFNPIPGNVIMKGIITFKLNLK
jgi:TonB family protein